MPSGQVRTKYPLENATPAGWWIPVHGPRIVRGPEAGDLRRKPVPPAKGLAAGGYRWYWIRSAPIAMVPMLTQRGTYTINTDTSCAPDAVASWRVRTPQGQR